MVFKSWLVSYIIPPTGVCFDLPDLDTGPVGPRQSSWVMALASMPVVVFVLSCVPVPCYATPICL